jgi:hypothetical protein
MKQSVLILMVIFCALPLSGCVTTGTDAALSTTESQLALRQMQSRSFETSDRTKTLRTIITTMQDLGFVIDKADQELGSISGTKLDGYQLRMTVLVRPKGKEIIVRANAQYNIHAVEDPEPYQQFFSALSKAMFLESNSVG